MTHEEYLKFHRTQLEKMYEITKAKNADYCKDTSDAFSNFSAVSALGIASTEQGFLTRITDKLCRINSFVQKGFLHVKDESVKDTLLDLANYCILFMGYLESKEDPALIQMAKEAEDGQAFPFTGIPEKDNVN